MDRLSQTVVHCPDPRQILPERRDEIPLDRRKPATFRGLSASNTLRLAIVLLLFICFPVARAKHCNACRFLVETFKKGLEETKKGHFGGGNTAWEEKSLGKYATSETRLVEIFEYTCRSKDGLDKAATLFGFDLNTDKDAENACHRFLEEHEETVENYYFHKKASEPNMYQWLCINTANVCCPKGTYGPECQPCPTAGQNEEVCYGRGTCDGDGTRSGTGKCKCNLGYVGNVCRKCATNFYVSEYVDDKSITCTECHESCKGGCTQAGPENCKDCKSGWNRINDVCEDINECESETSPCAEDKFSTCVNTAGSYRCDCIEGFKKDIKGKNCVIDYEAAEKKIDAERLKQEQESLKENPYEYDDQDEDEDGHEPDQDKNNDKSGQDKNNDDIPQTDGNTDSDDSDDEHSEL